MARELGLPAGWLNDAVKGFLLGPEPFATESLDLPGLRCEIVSAEVVLVMKALAHRIGEDDDDLVGSRLLTPQVQFFVEAAMDEVL